MFGSPKDWLIAVVCALFVERGTIAVGACFHSVRGVLPRVLLRLAIALMPQEQRRDMGEEWSVELTTILSAPNLTAWQQSRDALRYASSLIIHGGRVRQATRKLVAASSGAPRRAVRTRAEMARKSLRLWVLVFRLRRALRASGATPTEQGVTILLFGAVLAAAERQSQL